MKTAQEVETQLKEEYCKMLEFEYRPLPHTLKLETDWMEEDGITYQPIITAMCILNFLMINSDIIDLSDYYALKGYSCFKQY